MEQREVGVSAAAGAGRGRCHGSSARPNTQRPISHIQCARRGFAECLPRKA